jgi:hypothetical protein
VRPTQPCVRARGVYFCYKCTVFESSKLFGFGFNIFIRFGDPYRKSSTHELCLCCRVVGVIANQSKNKPAIYQGQDQGINSRVISLPNCPQPPPQPQPGHSSERSSQPLLGHGGKSIPDCLSEGYTGVNGAESKRGRLFLAGLPLSNHCEEFLGLVASFRCS